MIIEFLGTGTSQGVPVILCQCEVCQSTDPRDKRLRTSVAVTEGNYTIVIDAGPDFRTQILRSHVKKLDAILLTHEHNDHVAGMDDVRPFNFKQQKSMPVYGLPRVIKEMKSRYHYAFTKQNYPGAPSYEPIEINHNTSFKIGPFNIQAFEVIHGNLPILSYRINDFVYITDAKYINEESRAFAQNAELLVINALREQQHWSHFTIGEAKQMVDKLGARRNYFTHMSHLIGKHEDISKHLPENMSFAFDGFKIEL